VAELHGKWLAPVHTVLIHGLPAEVLETHAAWLRLVVPPGPPGPADVVAIGDWGFGVLPDGYLYYSPGADLAGFVAIIPSHGPETGGNLVSLLGCQMAADPSPAVRFAGAAASLVGVSPEQCSIVVKAPPGKGAADVTVDAGGKLYAKDSGYVYEASLSADQYTVSPSSGPFQGGTLVTLSGLPSTQDVQVLFGPLAAVDLQPAASGVLTAVTPAGSPGFVDVTVVIGGQAAVLADAYLYTVDEPEIFALSPNYGSRAGHTFFEVIGAGFDPSALVHVGELPAGGVQVKSYGTIWAYSPPHDLGTVDVDVEVKIGVAGLPAAFTYFDPMSEYGGT
jgi:hypothetical protein